MRRLIAIAAAILCLAAASDPAERLADPAQEARARTLFQEVRCVVCQNESIDDSDAELAADLRRLVRDQVRAGKTDDQIRAHLTARYGEFVLLKPAISWSNAVLWSGPFLVVALGLWLLSRRFRNRTAEETLSPEEAARLARVEREEQV